VDAVGIAICACALPSAKSAAAAAAVTMRFISFPVLSVFVERLGGAAFGSVESAHAGRPLDERACASSAQQVAPKTKKARDKRA
jgi:hypothetical protein